ncbi:glycoside hydrolase family 2 protein [Deinococcus oregonensis]|uniref:Glycoside hydrolase family 2 protein n=1 Tax=Deinococcus oregonensis TaxID=1805970 RepID=A0ABV6B408_9DEIO
MKPSLHPRPLLERAHWHSLNGVWEFAFDNGAQWRTPEQVTFDQTIQVPFPPESPASGIHDPSFHHTLWYRLTVTPQLPAGADAASQRLWLHFGAVDYQATVWVNGQQVATHEGGHTPFSADLTDVWVPGEAAEIVVRAIDDPHDLAKPRGKQDWEAEPHEIWYPRTSGIWQTVWLEFRPQTSVASVVWTSNVERWEVTLQARIQGPVTPETRLRVRLEVDGQLLANDEYDVVYADVSRTLTLRDFGIDAARRFLLWTPEHPQLIAATLEVVQGGEILDRVQSYTAMRSVAVDAQHFLLNGRPYPLKMVLDQGYWPEGLMSATDEQLRRDVELTRLLGFNGARKHQKIEDPRYLYWCDVLGLLVWEELPSAYIFTGEASRRLTQEWIETIERDRSHPCVVAWVPFNESWGVPDLPLVPAQRDLVRALYHLTKALDPTRPVIGNDGWEYVITDILNIHDYTHLPQKLLNRYGTPEALQASLNQVRPHKRLIALDETRLKAPAMLTEFGGIAFTREDDDMGWGYNRKTDAQSFLTEYTALLAAVHQCTGLVGFCYTQLTDTFQEKNGLLYEDRTPKADLRVLAEANRGERSAQDIEKDRQLDDMGYDFVWRKKRQHTEQTSPPSSLVPAD